MTFGWMLKSLFVATLVGCAHFTASAPLETSTGNCWKRLIIDRLPASNRDGLKLSGSHPPLNSDDGRAAEGLEISEEREIEIIENRFSSETISSSGERIFNRARLVDDSGDESDERPCIQRRPGAELLQMAFSNSLARQSDADDEEEDETGNSDNNSQIFYPDGIEDFDENKLSKLRRVKRKIIGKDDRQRVPSARLREAPSASVCAIRVKGGQPRCTGTLVSPRHVLTAAHCLFDNEQRIDKPIQVGFLRRKRNATHWMDVQEIHIAQEWLDHAHDRDNHDYAILTLKKCNLKTPHLKVSSADNLTLYDHLNRSNNRRSRASTKVWMISHHGNNTSSHLLFVSCNLYSQDQHRFLTRCDAARGSSGSAMYVFAISASQSSSKIRIVGVFGGNIFNFNFGTRLTDEKLDTICGWAPEVCLLPDWEDKAESEDWRWSWKQCRRRNRIMKKKRKESQRQTNEKK